MDEEDIIPSLGYHLNITIKSEVMFDIQSNNTDQVGPIAIRADCVCDSGRR